MRNRLATRLCRVCFVGVASALLASVMLAVPGAAAPPGVPFRAYIGGCAVWGEAPPNIRLRVIHQDGSGHQLGRTDVQADATGRWSIRCLPGGAIRSGHRLVAKDGSTLLRLRVVPVLSMTVDRATNELRVRGPAHTDLHFVLDSCIPGDITCYGGAADLMLQTDGSGRYQTSLDADVRGGDQVRLTLDDPDTTDFFGRRQYVPYLQVRRGSSTISGGARPSARVHVQVRRHGALRATASDTAAADDGSWSGRLRRHARRVPVATGDRVKGDHASDGVLDVMATRVTVDLATGTPHVRCYPYGRFGLRISDPDTTTAYTQWGTLDRTGEKDLPAQTIVQSGWIARLWCASHKGDVVYRRSLVP